MCLSVLLEKSGNVDKGFGDFGPGHPCVCVCLSVLLEQSGNVDKGFGDFFCLVRGTHVCLCVVGAKWKRR